MLPHFLHGTFITIRGGLAACVQVLFLLAETSAAESIVITTPATRKPPIARRIVRLSLTVRAGVWFCVWDWGGACGTGHGGADLTKSTVKPSPEDVILSA